MRKTLSGIIIAIFAFCIALFFVVYGTGLSSKEKQCFANSFQVGDEVHSLADDEKWTVIEVKGCNAPYDKSAEYYIIRSEYGTTKAVIGSFLVRYNKTD